MFIFWILVGIVCGYLFKPQIDKLLGRAVKAIRDNSSRDKY